MTSDSLAKATPLPWLTEDAEHPADIRIYSEGHRKLIAVIGNAEKPWTDHVEEWQANAELIVAAVNGFDRLTSENRGSKQALKDGIDGIDALKEENLRLREALLLAEQFIVNGTELGFIRMPDKNDSALDTLPKIRAALGEVQP